MSSKIYEDRALEQRPGKGTSANAIVDINGEEVPLTVTFSPRAKRYTLRLDPRTGGARLTLPTRANLDDAIRFLKRHERWLTKERDRLLQPVRFDPGAIVPLRGVPHEIQRAEQRGRAVWAEPGPDGDDGGIPVVRVAGAADMVATRVTSWLKDEAKADLTDRVDQHARRLRVKPARIAVRDQRTRWGSCSTTGTLSFSWRLILAPPEVLDYVAAHEVAHLKEMNHSDRFWALVRETFPDMDTPRAWLAEHGQSLQRYGSR